MVKIFGLDPGGFLFYSFWIFCCLFLITKIISSLKFPDELYVCMKKKNKKKYLKKKEKDKKENNKE